MKYVILIHSNPDPWGHPTSSHTAEGRALPTERHAEMARQFDALMEEISASGEFVVAEALAAPGSSTVYGWGSGRSARDRRPVRRDEGAAGRLLPDRLRDPRTCRADRRPIRLPRRRHRATPGDVGRSRRSMTTESAIEDVWRQHAAHVLAALVRRSGDFDAAEDAAQEALLAATRQWPVEGMPDNPKGWLDHGRFAAPRRPVARRPDARRPRGAGRSPRRRRSRRRHERITAAQIRGSTTTR